MGFVIMIILGIIFADFSTILFHWFEDTYLSYCLSLPILSQIARENEMHHYLPFLTVSSLYFESIDLQLIVLMIVLIILLVFFWNHFVDKYIFYITAMLFSILITLNHTIMHEKDCRKHVLIKWIYKHLSFLIVNTETHRKHHINPTSNYGVFIQPLNVFLDSINFFRILEFIILLTIGIKAKHKTPYYEYEHTDIHKHINSSICPDRLTKVEIQKMYSNLDDLFKCNLNLRKDPLLYPPVL